jgi:nucleolar MIF4G domain-containing protein 1
MPRPRHKTTALPRDLRSELGIRDTYGEKKRRLNGPASRKERRQNERTEKKSRHAAPQNKKVFQRPQQQARNDNNQKHGDRDLDLDSDDMDMDEKPSPPRKKAKSIKEAEKPKSILKKASAAPQESESESEPGSEIDLNESEDEDEDEEEEDEDESDEEAYEDMPDENEASDSRISGSVKSKLAQDDAEIAALEKKLGLKKGSKLPKAFEDDGLDDILGDLGGGGGDVSEDESRKRKREADDWLQAKRLKAKAQQAQTPQQDDSEMDSEEDVDLDEQIFGSDDGESAEGSDFDGFDEEESKVPKKKENPYIAPVTKPQPTAQKYIPPSLRARSDPESEDLTRLKRQAQGQLNKLSEANMLSIVAEFEKLYRDYPRQHVTSTLINLLMGLICERAALNDTFLILHAGFISALYKLLGMDFGAEIVQTVVETLDARGDERGQFQGKETLNLVSLLSQLYNFHVIGSSLMFDYVRLFVQDITEANTELLLKVIRSKSSQSRLNRFVLTYLQILARNSDSMTHRH